MVSDDEYAKPTIRSKGKTIDRTWTGHNPSVQTYEISDDKDTADTQEKPRDMGLCIHISPSQDQEDESKDAQPHQVIFNIDSAIKSEEQQISTYNTAAEFPSLHYKYGHLSFKRIRRMENLGITPKKFANCDTHTCVSYMFANYAFAKNGVGAPERPHTTLAKSPTLGR